MKVTLTQAGGYAGLVRTTELDSTRLPADEAATLEALVREVSDAEARPQAAPHPDAFEYELRIVEDDGRTRVIRLTEEPLPSAAQRLVKFVRAKGTAAKPDSIP
jgi:hypothetical protein